MVSVNIYGCALTFTGTSTSGTVSGVTITGIPEQTVAVRDVTKHTDTSKQKRAGRLKDSGDFAFNVLAQATDLPIGEQGAFTLTAPYDAASGYGVAASGIKWFFSGFASKIGTGVGSETEDITNEYTATITGVVAKSGY